MTQIDFYVLENGQPPHQFACKLIEKIYQKKLTVFVHTNDVASAKSLDTLLWTFSDISFIPHQLEDNDNECPITLGFHTLPEKPYDVLLILSDAVPSNLQYFKRIIELVTNDENNKKISREHFRYYRQHQLEIKTHQIK
jgi:DNA polymerase-3 subunit chi